MNLNLLKEFAEWCPLRRYMVMTDEQYWKALHELMELAEEYPEVMRWE